MKEKFRVLCADPPWMFNDKLPGEGRGAERNYRCMSTYDIQRFPLPPLADDCVLALWRVAVLQQSALDVVRAWKFTLGGEIVWLKKTTEGRRWFGMGRIVRAEHEICLLARRGRNITRDHSVRSTFKTDVDFSGLSARVGAHSEKPEEFYKIIESLFPGPYCELFARRHRPGWTCMGDELTEAAS